MQTKLFDLRVYKKNKIWVLFGVALLVALILGGFWHYSMRSSGGTPTIGGFGPIDQTASTTLAAASSTTAVKQNTPASTHKLSSVVTIAENLSGASQFISLFTSTGVASALVGKGPYTVFVPTNGAFSQLPAGTLSNMTPAQKLRFIKYHVIVGRAIDSQAQVAGTIQAFSGDMLNFSYGVDKIPMVNSAIFIQKYLASNGVVYLIDNVLLPPLRSR